VTSLRDEQSGKLWLDSWKDKIFSLLRPDAVEKRKIFFPSLVVQPVAYTEHLRNKEI
jgi:hypothetical protein